VPASDALYADLERPLKLTRGPLPSLVQRLIPVGHGDASPTLIGARDYPPERTAFEP